MDICLSGGYPHPMPVIVLASDKGGTAKTTTVANLLAALRAAPHHARVCGVDCDPQGDLGALYGLDDYDGPRLGDWLTDPGRADLSPAVSESGVAIIPGGLEQADVAQSLTALDDGHLRLREVCDRLASDYDWIVLDPPPGTAPMVTLAMFAADAALVPAAPTDLDVRGATALLARVEDGEFDDDARRLVPLGVLLTQTKPRRILRRQAHTALERAGIPVVPIEIPNQERVGGHMRLGRPTVEVEPDGRVAGAYRNLAAWLVTENEKANA